jgi:hypothetical protein
MKNILINFIIIICAMLFVTSCDKDESNPIVLTAAGNIQSTLDDFRSMLGPDNGSISGSQSSGRRELNWDAVPDSLAAPNFLPRDFFNTNIGTRARGADFTTPGGGVQVSADSNNPFGALPSFGNINPSYQQTFPPFSAERIFSPIGSNIVDLRFFVPGSTTPAVVKGFGAIYIDVDNQENTAFEYFDINDNSLGVYATPILNEGHVFLGVIFETPRVHRVRIEYGNSSLGPDDGNGIDVAVMDDFIYGEPQEVQ